MSRAQSFLNAEEEKSLIDWQSLRQLIWRVPRDISVSEWADKNRVLDPKTSAEPGYWHTDRTPYLRGIMDAFCDNRIEEITVKASTQVGKTESFLNMLGFAIDQDPGPALVVMPRKEDAKMMNEDRIQPMIRLSPALSQHLTGIADDVTQFVVNLDRMILYLAWANSPAALAAKPIRYLFFDETNKYPPFSGREADPIELASERTRTFYNRKIVKVSTPTTADGYISREYEMSDKCRYFVPCPHCGTYQVLLWPQVRFPKEVRNPQQIREKKLAWYECKKCKRAILDAHKPKMLRQGKWVPEGCRIDKDGTVRGKAKAIRHKGFWINALYSPWLSFSDVAAKWLEAQERRELLMNFVNSWLAEEWREKIEERKPERLKRLSLSYREGEIPEGVMVLTAGVDVQLDHFYYVVRGWGIGYESWLISANRVESWEDITKQVFEKTFVSSDKKQELGVTLACVDTGYRTEEVYEVCRQWIGLARPIKGSDNLRGLLYKASNIDKYPSGRVIPGGLRLYHIDTILFKDKLARLIATGTEGKVSKFHLYRRPKKIYLEQMCAEGKVLEKAKSGRPREAWRLLPGHRRSDFWDCEVYALAAAEMLRVYALREEDFNSAPKSPSPPASQPGRWVSARRGWIRR